jgi:acyl-CoA synthetase (NDP forming)
MNTYGGKFYPVNPKLSSVFGRECYRSVREVPDEVDVVAIVIGDVFGVIDDALAKRPKFVVVYSSELRDANHPTEEEAVRHLVELCLSAGCRLIGPNTNLNTFEVLLPSDRPKFGIVSQSGHQGRPLVTAQKLGFGVSRWITTGNEADLEAADFIEYMARDPETSAIAAYIEGFRDGDRLRSAAAACRSFNTPLVVVKVGQSPAGAQAVLTHTGHMAGEDRVLDAFFEQEAIIRVGDLDELLEVTAVLARAPKADASGVAILSPSGGTCAHMAEVASLGGLSLPTLSDHTQAALRTYLPEPLGVSNPVDHGTVAFIHGHGPAIVEAILADPAIGVLLYEVAEPYTPMRQPLIDAAQFAVSLGKPIIALSLMPNTDDIIYRTFAESRVPVVRNIRNGVSAARALVLLHGDRMEQQDALSREVQHTASVGDSRVLTEPESLALINARGVQIPRFEIVSSAEDAVKVAEDIGFPTVLKAFGSKLAHKTELGAVVTGIRSAEEMMTAYQSMAARLEGVDVQGYLVAQQMSGGVELMAGIIQDSLLGPAVVIGSGGVDAELLDDVAILVVPFSAQRAEKMLDALRISPALSGWRGHSPIDKRSVIEVLLVLQELALSKGVYELDINPLLATSQGAIALDALAQVSESGESV